MGQWTGIVIVGICVLGVYKLFELFVCKRERLSIIEKLGDKIAVADLSGKFTLPGYGKTNIPFGALKAGCLMFGIGLGLLIGYLIAYHMISDYAVRNSWEAREAAGIVYGACVMLFGGLGLLIAFLIELRISKKENKV